jgi:hypothetical protein
LLNWALLRHPQNRTRGPTRASPPPMDKRNEVIKNARRPEYLPHPTDDENEHEKQWFERDFFPRICVQEFLNIAINLREGEHTCHFDERMSDTLHVVIFMNSMTVYNGSSKSPNEMSMKRRKTCF